MKTSLQCIIGAALLLGGFTATSRADFVYVAKNTSLALLKFNGAGVGSVFASTGLSGPGGLAFDTAGNLYVANWRNDTIEKFTPGGIGSLFASTGVNDPLALAFDSAGNLLVGNDGTNTIQKFTSAGVGSVFASGLNGPAGLAFGSAGELYVSNLNDGTITKIAADGVRSQFANTGSHGTTALAVTNDFGVPLPLANQRVVPEPGTWVTGIALCLPALVGRFRRRKR